MLEDTKFHRIVCAMHSKNQQILCLLVLRSTLYIQFYIYVYEVVFPQSTMKWSSCPIHSTTMFIFILHCLYFVVFLFIPATFHERVGQEVFSPVTLDRDIFEVTLRKEPHVGIGITIVGGENTDGLDLGIFVKTITPDSPADIEGRIKPGDRIIAINGHSLEGKQHHIAVKLIQQATNEVKLLVSQVRPPKTIRRKANGDTSVQAKLHMSVNSDNDVNIFNELNSQNGIDQYNPAYGIDGALHAEYSHGQHNSKDIPGNHRTSVLSLSSDSSAHSRMSARDSIKTESLPDDERYSDTENSRGLYF